MDKHTEKLENKLDKIIDDLSDIKSRLSCLETTGVLHVKHIDRLDEDMKKAADHLTEVRVKASMWGSIMGFASATLIQIVIAFTQD